MKDLQKHDLMVLVQVTEAYTKRPVAAAGSKSLPDDANLQAASTDLFPAELYSHLLSAMYHTSALTQHEPPAAHKELPSSAKLGSAELQQQVADLLQKVCRQPSSTPGAVMVAQCYSSRSILVGYWLPGPQQEYAIKNRYSLLRIGDMCDKLQGTKVSSSVDLQCALNKSA